MIRIPDQFPSGPLTAKITTTLVPLPPLHQGTAPSFYILHRISYHSLCSRRLLQADFSRDGKGTSPASGFSERKIPSGFSNLRVPTGRANSYPFFSPSMEGEKKVAREGLTQHGLDISIIWVTNSNCRGLLRGFGGPVSGADKGTRWGVG